jgi:hypothetical protein
MVSNLKHSLTHIESVESAHSGDSTANHPYLDNFSVYKDTAIYLPADEQSLYL